MQTRHERQRGDVQRRQLLRERPLVVWGWGPPVGTHRAGTIANVLGAGTSRAEEAAYTSPSQLGNAFMVRNVQHVVLSGSNSERRLRFGQGVSDEPSSGAIVRWDGPQGKHRTGANTVLDPPSDTDSFYPGSAGHILLTQVRGRRDG